MIKEFKEIRKDPAEQHHSNMVGNWPKISCMTTFRKFFTDCCFEGTVRVKSSIRS